MASSIVNELINREIIVTASARHRSKLNNLLYKNKNITRLNGDIFSKKQLEHAVGETSIILHVIGLPYTVGKQYFRLSQKVCSDLL